MYLEEIDTALREERYETARRLCEAALNDGVIPAQRRNDCLWRLHRAHRAMCNIESAISAVEKIVPGSEDEALDVVLNMAEDFHRRAHYGYYRDSDEAHEGQTYEDFEKRWSQAATERFGAAAKLAKTPAQRKRVAQTRKQSRPHEAAPIVEVDEEESPVPAGDEAVSSSPGKPVSAAGTLSGTVRFASGQPVVASVLTLGSHVTLDAPEPASFDTNQLSFRPEIGPQRVFTCVTDHQGCFTFKQIPAGEYDFVAVALDPAKFDISTRFVARDITVTAGAQLHFDWTVQDWQSAPADHAPSPMPTELIRAGVRYRRVHELPLRNPFHYSFPQQLIGFNLPMEAGSKVDRLLLVSSSSMQEDEAFQLCGDRLVFFTDLPAMSEKWFGLYVADELPRLAAVPKGRLPTVEERPFGTAAKRGSENPAGDLRFEIEHGSRTGIIDTGRARFRLPAGKADQDASPPLLAVCGEDGAWRGNGRLRFAAGVTVVSRETSVIESGPLVLRVRIAYRLSSGHDYSIEFTAHRDEPYLLAHEICPDEPGSFEFSLKEFSGGRGYLHWCSEREGTDNLHWSDLDAHYRELARLQESVAWWVPPMGFAYAMTGSQVRGGDYIGVFTIRRGDWIDRKFKSISQGPGDDHRELDWPYPEMSGSTISMITACTSADGDAFFKFGFFDGERHWGILVSTLDRNDGRWKELSCVQHKNSSPRLDDFKEWQLDEADRIARPFVMTRRDELRNLRKKKESPTFAPIWEKIRGSDVAGATAGLRFAIDGDPAVAWRKKLEFVYVAQIYPRMILLGREFCDFYSPVGARCITPWVEEYDLIAASGVFTPEEERIVRRFFMLMGHMYMEPDFMNWKFNSRNANFEADRVDVVGALGLAFRGNPDADACIAHAAGLMERSINVYCTPGSGKWYENPSCYYLHAMKCRMNLAFHLATHGVLDSTKIPRLKDFLRWGVLLLTPRCPHKYELMRDGTNGAAGYEAAEKVRRIAPIGDHGHIGPWVPDHYALMAKLYRKADPDFADLLLWAWYEGGADGAYHGNLPLVFTGLSEQDLKPPMSPAPVLESRRLEGFGAVIRGNFGMRDESYLLLKQGPGGYRYHRTEGSIILFAYGKPLIYDGGEAGDTWRHSTLSFHDVHMPLAAGHVERFHALPAIGFVQGVHPKALDPGERVFLSEHSHHDLVQVAYDRFNEPNPAVVRTLFSLGNQYVVMHDDLHLDPKVISHWHLQAVADSHEHNASTGYRFFGRFGVDLQVLLPDQAFTTEMVEQVPIVEYHLLPKDSFSMRHLMVTGQQPQHYLAVLRPLTDQQTPVTARSIVSQEQVAGVQITGKDIDDRLWFSRQIREVTGDGHRFVGRYGALLVHGDSVTLAILEGSLLSSHGVTIESDGPALQVSLTAQAAAITAQGEGTISVQGLRDPLRLSVRGSTNLRIPRLGN